MSTDFGDGGSQGEDFFGDPPSSPLTPPSFGPTVQAAKSPPPISGGSLAISRDGTTAIVADPDRDAVYLVDLASNTLRQTIALNPGDEPGRVVEDGAKVAHVILRSGGGVASIDLATGTLLGRRTVCAAPRGIGYLASADSLLVACLGGELVTLPASYAMGVATNRVQVADDLRDVVVVGSTVYVSIFRSAALLQVNTDGSIAATSAPVSELGSPTVAWRTIVAPPSPANAEMGAVTQILMVHEIASNQTVQTTQPGGYGGGCNGQIVQGAVTKYEFSPATSTNVDSVSPESAVAQPSAVLPVDIAWGAATGRMVVLGAGNAHNPGAPMLFEAELANDDGFGGGVAESEGMSPPAPSAPPDPSSPVDAGPSDAATSGSSGSIDASVASPPSDIDAGGAIPAIPDTGVGVDDVGTLPGGSFDPCGNPTAPEGNPPGEPVAIAFDSNEQLVSFSREPASLSHFVNGAWVTIPLAATSVEDTGHAIFHANSGAGLACASCHAEARDDGHVWTFDVGGPRRTQTFRGGFLQTAPFHWGGEMTSMPMLIDTVFVHRMSGPTLPTDEQSALGSWMDALPLLPHDAVTDPTAQASIARGKTYFEGTGGCTSCHTGATLTNNQTIDVGTGAPFQVPSLRDVAFRAPYMHDGCAASLTDRFTDPTCGGGIVHGNTRSMSAGDVSDLVAYLRTL